jgi:hypothetical protein
LDRPLQLPSRNAREKLSEETMKPHTTDGHSTHMIECICDAFGKGFDQANRRLVNPYKEGSDLHYAYQNGKEVEYARA